MPISVTMPDKQHKFQIKTAGSAGVADFSDARGGNTRARDRLRHFFSSYDDLFVLTGPAGPGKTHLVTELFKELGSEIPIAFFDAEQLAGHSLFQSTFNAFGLTDWSDDWEAVMNSLANRLRSHDHAFLLITNAHKLEQAAFEDIRRISYLRSGRGPLLQTILVGEDQLLEKVESCDMARLNQWQIERYCMSPRSLPADRTLATPTREGTPSKAFTPVDRHPIPGIDGDKFTPEAPVLIHTSEHNRASEYETSVLLEPAAPLHDVGNILRGDNGTLSAKAHLPSILNRADIVQEHPSWHKRLRRPVSAVAMLLAVLWGGYMLGQQQASHSPAEPITGSPTGKVADSIEQAAQANGTGQTVADSDPPPSKIQPTASWWPSQEPALAGGPGKTGESVRSGSVQVIIPFPAGATPGLDTANEQPQLDPGDSANVDESHGDVSASTEDALKPRNVEELLAAGQAAIQKNYLRTPYDKSAWNFFNQVLELEPGNKFATQGMEDIAARYALLTELALERGKYTTAQVYIDRGLGISAENKQLLALDQKLQAALSATEVANEQQEQTRSTTKQTQAESEQSPKPKGLTAFFRKIFTPRQPPTN